MRHEKEELLKFEKELDKEFIIELLQQRKENLENQLSIVEAHKDMVNKKNVITFIRDQIELWYD